MDGLSAIIIACGIAAAGYYIGSGIRYGLVFFKSGKLNEDENVNQSDGILYDKLIKEEHIHSWLGISKKDSGDLLKEYPDIPHLEINGNIYYIREGLNEWIKKQNNIKN